MQLNLFRILINIKLTRYFLFNMYLCRSKCFTTYCVKMKKLISILLSLFLLVSGLHLTLATHICGGEVAAVKWSIVHESATCGMKPLACKTTSGNHLQSNCCHDEIRSFVVDSNYAPSASHEVKVAKSFIQMFYVPTSFGIDIVSPVRFLFTNFNPPLWISLTDVCLAKICVFRN